MSRNYYRDRFSAEPVHAWHCDGCGVDIVAPPGATPSLWKTLTSYRRTLDLCPDCVEAYASDTVPPLPRKA